MNTPAIGAKVVKIAPLALAQRGGVVLAVSLGLFIQPLHAATTVWTGAINSTWATAGNWTAGVPTASDQAVFNNTFTNQPSIGVAALEGIWLATGVDQDVAILGNGAITLTGTGTINGNANTAILLDDTANHSLSIGSTNPVITLANDTQFLVNNSGTLTIYKTNLNGKTLTLGGTNAAGNINFTSVIGTTNPAGAIIVNTAGTVTFSSVGTDNTFSGGVTLNAGTLRVANRGNNLGTGALTLAGGELQLATDAGSSFGRPTTVTGNTKVTSDRLTAGAGVTHSLGTLSIGAQTLSIAKGANVTSGTAGITFGVTTLTGNATVDTAADTNLKLGALAETGGARSLTKTGAGLLTLSSTTNTTTGGLIIKQGTVDASSGNTSAGDATNTVTLGDSAGGSNNASFVSSASQTYANPFVVAANTTGTLSIGTVGTGAVGITYSGGITGSNNVTLANTGSGTMNFSTIAINNAGTVINSGSGTGLTTISGGIGSNVTGITQNSTTSALTIQTTALTVNSSVTTLTNASGTKLLTLSAATSGTGNLTLKNNSSTANGITISGSVNNTGLVINSGSGDGNTLISGVIGTNVTGVEQNSATSILNLTGTNTFTTGLSVKQGTVQLGAAAAAGTGTITLGNTSGSAGANLMLTLAGTYANALALGTGGTLTLINNTSNNTTYSGAVTGTNDLTISNNNVGGGAMSMSGLINNTGKLTFNGTAAGANLLTGGIGSSVTAITHNTDAGLLTISGAVAVNSSGLTLTNNSSSKLFLISGVVSGSGGITKTGSGAVTLSGANAAYTGETKILAGNLALNAANSGGTGRIYVGDTTGSANSGLYIGGSGISIANNITVQTANTGITTLGSNSANAGTFSGNITLTGDGNVTLNPFNSTLTFTPASGTSITGDGGLIITSSGMATSTTGQSYGISGATVTLSGANTYTGATKILSGLLQISTAAAGNVNNRLGTANSAVVIGDTSGVQSARFVINTSVAGAIFSRDLFIQGGNGGISGVGVTQNSGGTFSGNLSLEKTVHLLGPNNGTTSTTFSGVISKAPTAIGAVSVNVSGDRLSNVALTNANTYDGGTIVGGGLLIGSVAGSLGSGNAGVDAGSLRLNSDTALAANKTVLVGPRGQLSITSASGIDQADLIALLAPGSTGSIGISGTYSTALDLATLGDGNMYLGNDGSNGTYSASSLGASGGFYRVGWSTGGAGTLTLSTGVLIGANQLIVGGTQGNVNPAGNNGQGHHTEGNVILSAANTYTGGTVVNSGSTLQGQALTSGTVFGSTTSAMTLHNSTLRILNSGTTTTNTIIGDVAFDGGSIFMMNGSGTSNNTLTVASLDRIDRGTLTITPSGTGAALASTVFVKTGGTLATAGTVKNSASTSVTMLAPYYVDSLGNYLSYDSSTGFTPITTSLTTLALGRTNGVTSYVKMTANESIASDLEIAALSFANAANLAITNSTSTPVTLKIGTGGITSLASANNSVTIGSAANTVILDFNAKEAVFNLGGGTQNGGLTIHNAITNTGGNGLTKSGNGRLFLNSSLSTFTGLITVNQSAIYINNDLALGSGDGLENDIFLNGGGITSGNSVTLNATRTITLGTAGGSLTSGSANPFVVAGKITGTGGVLTLGSNNAATSTSRSTIYLSNIANDFIAPIYVGTAGANHHDLLFDDDRQLGNAANVVILTGGNAGLQYTGVVSGSTAREINFQNQGGAIDVLTAGVTLTASGPITGSGMFNKNGLGTLALTGSSSFSGTVNVNGGVLNVSHANALGATTAAITGSSGVSGGAAYVQSGAALEVQNNIALGGAGGKTLYLNGTGIGNAGALRNVSGANSNSGAVIFQSNTTIGVDSGSLALSGIVSGSGSLTKLGAGTFTLSGANTYSGGTTISSGSFIVNNTTGSGTGSGDLFIASGATLGGSGTIGGAATVNGSLNPGNSPGVITFNAGLSLGSTASTHMEIAGASRGTQYDGVNVSGGSLTYGGILAINFSSSTVSGTTYDLFNLSSGSPSGSFSSVSIAGTYVSSLSNNSGVWTGSASGYDFTFTQATGDLFVLASAIPEPSTTATLAALAAGLSVTLRRRRRAGLVQS